MANKKVEEKKEVKTKDVKTKETKAKEVKATNAKEEKAEEEEVIEETPVEGKKPVNNGKTYILSKRKEDGMWALKYSGGERVIKLFKTKAEALEFTKQRAENNDRGILVRASKGAYKGKFRK